MIFQYFSRQISFSRTFQESPLNSSTFQACANPDKASKANVQHLQQRIKYTGLDKQNFQRKIVNIFLPISLTYVLGAQKNHLSEAVLLSTHNICFG